LVANPKYPLIVILKDHGTDVDLKKVLEGIEYEETGNKEISNALIHINAKFGRFFKDSVQVGTRTFPKIEFFDRIYIRFTDPNGNITEDVLEVLKIKPSEIKGMGDVMEIHAEHQGYHLSRMHNLKQYQRESGFDMIEDNGSVYNSTDVRGTNQPTLESHNVEFTFPVSGKPFGNAASKATSLDMDFGNSEFYISDSIDTISNRLGSSVDSGGELEFFDWRTVSKYDHALDIDIDTIFLQFRKSGDIGAATKVVIDKASAVNKLLDTRGELEPEKATSVYAWGDNNSGSSPPGFQIYFGEKEFFLSAKQWTDGRFYKAGMRVQFEGGFFKTTQDHTANLGVNDPTTGIGTFWTVEIFTPTYDYSQLTKNKPQYWINSGAGYVDQQIFPATERAAMHDHNLVLRDINHRRSWVDVAALGLDDIPASMFRQGGGSEMYRTFRLLLDTDNGSNSLKSPFTQNNSKDRFGKDYAEAVVKHNGGTFTGTNEYLNWDVFLESKTDLEIITMRTGQAFIFNRCTDLDLSGNCTGGRQLGWVEGSYAAIQIAGTTIARFLPNTIPDCIHPYDILDNPPRPDFGNSQGIEPGTPGVNSAVFAKFTHFNITGRKSGAWLNLAWPIPRDGYDGAYGPSTVGEKFFNASLDFNNMHLSSFGKRGLNQGVSADGGRGSLDYGKISHLRQYLKYLGTAGFGFVPPGGDFKFRIAFFDDNDHVIVKDVAVTHNDNFDETETGIGEFEIYRGRHGMAFTPLQELEILDIFETRNVVRMSISTLESYDSDGRYTAFNRYSTFYVDSKLFDDGFHFVTPLNATTQEETIQANKPELNFERDPLDAPQISNYIQLKNHALSQLEIEQFKRVEWSITRPLRCDIKFGDEFTLKHPILIDDDVGAADEVDLVCRKNIFTYTKRSGYKTVTIGGKRFRT